MSEWIDDSRAMRRKQIFSELEKRQYPHVMQTNPEPVYLNSHITPISFSLLEHRSKNILPQLG